MVVPALIISYYARLRLEIERKSLDEQDEMGFGSMKEMTCDSEGAIVESLDLEDGILRIKYYKGTKEECPSAHCGEGSRVPGSGVRRGGGLE